MTPIHSRKTKNSYDKIPRREDIDEDKMKEIIGSQSVNGTIIPGNSDSLSLIPAPVAQDLDYQTVFLRKRPYPKELCGEKSGVISALKLNLVE